MLNCSFKLHESALREFTSCPAENEGDTSRNASMILDFSANDARSGRFAVCMAEIGIKQARISNQVQKH